MTFLDRARLRPVLSALFLATLLLASSADDCAHPDASYRVVDVP